MRLLNHVCVLVFIVLFFSIALVPEMVQADPGNFSLYSPFGCGSQCVNGYELNGYTEAECLANATPCFNTVDECKDGDSFTFEYVDDIYVLDLNQTTFYTGDTIEITGEFDCDSDGDAVSLAYLNGTTWQNIYNNTCNVSNKVNYSVNVVIDEVQGNHSVRATIVWDGQPGAICGYEQDTAYSDTDDLTFYASFPGDQTPPNLSGLQPPDGSAFESTQYPNITLAVLATDTVAVDTVIANVTWDGFFERVSLTDADADGNFTGTFHNTSNLTHYNITILANDTSGNNATLNGTFTVNLTSNITVHAPSLQQVVLETFLFSFTLPDNFTANWTGYEINGTTNYTVLKGFNVSSINSSQSTGFNLTSFSSLNESFMAPRNMTVKEVGLYLTRRGMGAGNMTVSIWNGTSAPEQVLGSGSLDNDTLGTSYAWSFVNLSTDVVLRNQSAYWLQLSGNGTENHTVGWQTHDDLLSGANSSADESKDHGFAIYDRYYHAWNITLPKGETRVVVFANNSATGVRSPFVYFSVDYLGPVFHNLTYTPNDADGLDPNVSVYFTLNVSDDLAMDTIFLQYRMANETAWQNRTVASGNSILANFTPDREHNWTYRIWANDTASNANTTASQNLSVLYERSWTWSPNSINTTGGPLATNVSLIDLVLNNTGDANLTIQLNKSDDTVNEIFFNDSLVVLEPGQSNTINATVTTLSISGQNELSLVLDALESNAVPNMTTLNATVVSNNSGTHLVLEFLEYDSVVTQGDARASYTVKVTNIGLTQATDVWLNFSLPDGWTNKSALFIAFGNFSFGESAEQTFVYSIDADAATGTVMVLAGVNSSEHSTDIGSRNVTVSSAGNPGGDNTGGSSDGTSTTISGGLTVVEQKDLVWHVPESIAGARGVNVTFNITVTNPSSQPAENISLAIKGIAPNRVWVDPPMLPLLEGNGEQVFVVGLHIPFYLPETEHVWNMTLSYNTSKSYVFLSEALRLMVLERTKDELWLCIEDASLQVKLLKDEGFQTGLVEDALKEVKGSYVHERFDDAWIGCRQLLSAVQDAQAVQRKLDSWDSGGTFNQADASLLSSKSLVLEAFHEGNFPLALERAALLERVLEGREQLRLDEQYADRAGNVAGILVLVLAILVFLFHKPLVHWWSRRSIHGLQKRQEFLEELLGELHSLYFKEHLLGKPLFVRYRQKVGDGMASAYFSQLRHEFIILKLSDKRTFETKARSRIAEAGEALQHRHFKEHSLSKEAYARLRRKLDLVSADIDKGEDA